MRKKSSKKACCGVLHVCIALMRVLCFSWGNAVQKTTSGSLSEIGKTDFVVEWGAGACLADTWAIGWPLSMASLTQIQRTSSLAMAMRLRGCEKGSVGCWWQGDEDEGGDENDGDAAASADDDGSNLSHKSILHWFWNEREIRSHMRMVLKCQQTHKNIFSKQEISMKYNWAQWKGRISHAQNRLQDLCSAFCRFCAGNGIGKLLQQQIVDLN